MDYDEGRKRLQEERAWIASIDGKHREKQRLKGKLLMPERIALLLDAESWLEYGEFARSREQQVMERSPRDGTITGIGAINGQTVAVIAHDITTMGGTQSPVNVKKVDRVLSLAIKKEFPIILLCEGGGVRLPDGVGVGFPRMLGLHPTPSLTTLAHPQTRPLLITALFDSCYGDQALWAAYADFTIMIKESAAALSGPPVIEAAIGEKITDRELGGPMSHQTITGVCDVVVDTDTAAIDAIKNILHMLRQPEACTDPLDRLIPDAEAIVPHFPRRAYDIREVITRICDHGEYLEIKTLFGTGLCIGLGRVAGRAVGIIASQPNSYGGAVDAKALRKSAEFIEFINLQKIPLLVLQDIPGLFVGEDVEKDGMLKAVQAHCRVMETIDVPMVTVVLRKTYGAAYYFLGMQASGAQFVAAWPNATISFMAPEIGAHILTKRVEAERKIAAVKKAVTELERGASVWDAAHEFLLDAIIDPKETRKIICHAFRLLC